MIKKKQVNQLVNTQEILNLLQTYSSDSYHIQDNIPNRKLNNIYKSFPIDRGEIILATVDGTVFGSHKNGLVFGEQGIYANNDFTGGSFSGFMTYSDFSQVQLRSEGASIFFGDRGFQFCFAGSMMKDDKLMPLLTDLQKLLGRNDQPSQASSTHFGCPGCGAPNQRNQCEYCGRKL